MTVYDMCVQGYNAAYEAKTDLSGRPQLLGRRFIGTDLTDLTTTATDSFKIFKLSKFQMVTRMWVIVTDADDTAITLKAGYTDGTNTSDTAYEASAALNSAAVTYTIDNYKLMDDDGYYVTITLSVLSTLDADCEFSIVAEVIDLRGLGITEALTAPV